MKAIKLALLYGVTVAVVVTVLASLGVGQFESIGAFVFGGIAGYLNGYWDRRALSGDR